MPRRYFDLTMTPDVLELQRETYDRAYDVGDGLGAPDQLGKREHEIVTSRDSFYMATVSSSGWPYVQHRGGPVGFLQILDDRTLGFADYHGNRQLLSAGNVRSDDRVALFLMDYPGRRRLKILGRLSFVPAADEPELAARLAPDGSAVVERVARIQVEAIDWNCPQHITPRFTLNEVEEVTAALRRRIEELEGQLSNV